MIGYLVEQELMNALPGEARCATLLTQVEVDDDDPAFVEPTKPIGPVYTQAEAAQALSEHGWTIIEESQGNWRRVVPSPVPRHITQISTIRLMVEAGLLLIGAGGGGLPVHRTKEGMMEGNGEGSDQDRP